MLRPVTLITGASAGIGAALARVFAARGHDIALVARRKAKLDVLAEAIASAGGTRPHVLAFDLAASEAAEHLAKELLARELQPEIVVNNAGFGLAGDAAALDRNEQLAMIDLNVRVVTDLSLRFLDALVRRRGALLNVASVAGFMPAPGMAVYHATKAYVLSFTEALHGELAGKGVRVTALCPGPVATEFQARAGIGKDYFPRVLSRTSRRVAEEGYDGLMRGRRLVVPGFANQVACFLPRILPRRGVLAMTAKRK
ncbi:MAG TPA: SDR family oxidoreductase [Xanthobacteraceae bacterium]|nr:SDR family oxidoreductase [Xanthobacteraceae bacterium]